MMALPFRLGGYGCIVADPPWHYDDQAGRMKLPYPSMSDAEILALPVDTLAADRGHLYVWTTDAHLELALACVRRWGFVFRRTLAWVKTNAPARQLAAMDAIEADEKEKATQLVHDMLKLQIGGGHYVRGAHELCLFATRDLTGLVRDVPSVILAPRTKHSAKPDELLAIAERLSPGPRIELFARRARDGWTAWGNQAPGHIEQRGPAESGVKECA